MTLASLSSAGGIFTRYVIHLFLLFLYNSNVCAENSILTENRKSLIVAMGCFWCGEESFERFAPGVIEAISGYSGGSNDNPTYRNHPGHFEVVLVQYDPTKSSYASLLRYAWRNIDPFDGTGQFCDRGKSYQPAIFFADEEERSIAESVKAEMVLELSAAWNGTNVEVPLLQRTVFWVAEDYHQNYYIKNPGKYVYYKNACGRPKRLKAVWGNDVYECYHDVSSSCFNGTLNSAGETVPIESNIKQIEETEAGKLPLKLYLPAILLVTFVGSVRGAIWLRHRRSKRSIP